MNRSKDSLLQSHPCEVGFKHIHNHDTVNAAGDVLQHRRPSPEVVDSFTQMFTDFKARVSPAQAMRIHLSNLEKEYPDHNYIGDGALCPEMPWVYKLYKQIMTNKCEEAYGPEMISALKKKC